MDLQNRIDGIEKVRFAGSGSRSPDVDTGDRTRLNEDNRTAGRPSGIGEVSDLDPWDIGESVLRHSDLAAKFLSTNYTNFTNSGTNS